MIYKSSQSYCSSDNYAITKSKQYCITWSEGEPDAEVIDAVTGSVAMEWVISLFMSSHIDTRLILDWKNMPELWIPRRAV